MAGDWIFNQIVKNTLGQLAELSNMFLCNTCHLHRISYMYQKCSHCGAIPCAECHTKMLRRGGGRAGMRCLKCDRPWVPN